MNDWANYLAIVPAARSTGNADTPAGREGYLSAAASALPPSGYRRKLFLQLFLSSLFLAVSGKPARAVDGSNQPSGNANQIHIHQQLNLGLGLPGQQSAAEQSAPFCMTAVPQRSRLTAESRPAAQSAIQPINHSSGAILAHQVTASSKPQPAARSGVATASPRFGGLNIDYIQICTQGYSVFPGIPNPVFSSIDSAPGKQRQQPFRSTRCQKHTISTDQSIRNL